MTCLQKQYLIRLYKAYNMIAIIIQLLDNYFICMINDELLILFISDHSIYNFSFRYLFKMLFFIILCNYFISLKSHINK